MHVFTDIHLTSGSYMYKYIKEIQQYNNIIMVTIYSILHYVPTCNAAQVNCGL